MPLPSRFALLFVVFAPIDHDHAQVWTLPSTFASSWICTASSRVGAIMIARGLLTPSVAVTGSVSRQLKVASRNAAVLPVPVCACPATSMPASARGRVPAWIGVQRTNPAASTPASRGAGSRAR